MNPKQLSLLTDLYQLTMLAGYHGSGKLQQKACFELFFRRLPFQGGFCVAAGLEPVLEYLENLEFDAGAISYLKSLKLFSDSFLEWLRGFRFSGELWAVAEGEIVFPHEPLLRVIAPLPEAQLIESTLLNLVNFQTLVATKAARVCLAAQGDSVLEFGLRRAQGINGAMAASRAAYIGGVHATSNCLAGQQFCIPVKGTHAHSWIMSFSSELEAFQAYADHYPQACTLLVDTYDTLKSGVPNAIKVGDELKRKGHQLAGIRLDSGDMAELSRSARSMLDEAGHSETKIVASNDLDEYKIRDLKKRGAAIDVWGVGTNLVTCRDEPALGGVYKLAAAENTSEEFEPRIKISANPIKTSIPGIKELYRLEDEAGRPLGDALSLVGEVPLKASPLYSPNDHKELRRIAHVKARPLLKRVWRNGERLLREDDLERLRERTQRSLEKFSPSLKRLENPDSYFLGMTEGLTELRQSLISSALEKQVNS